MLARSVREPTKKFKFSSLRRLWIFTHGPTRADAHNGGTVSVAMALSAATFPYGGEGSLGVRSTDALHSASVLVCGLLRKDADSKSSSRLVSAEDHSWLTHLLPHPPHGEEPF